MRRETVVALSLSVLGPILSGARTPESVTLSNGVVMPMISAGTWLYNNSVASASVMAAISVGFRHIDTAYDYNNQQGVGMGLKLSGKNRSDIFITSKIPGCGAAGVKDCFGDTLRLIQTDIEQLGSSGYKVDYLDLILIHFPPCLTPTCRKTKSGCDGEENCQAIADQWRALETAYENGLVRAVGVSNYCRACFKCLKSSGVSPMVNQVQMHVGMGPDPQGFRTYANNSGFVLQAWSPLGNGNSPEILKGNLTSIIAQAHKKTPAQVALKWLVSKGVAVSTKSASPLHLQEDLDIFSWDLTKEEEALLDKADFAHNDTPSFLCSDSPQEEEEESSAQLVI